MSFPNQELTEHLENHNTQNQTCEYCLAVMWNSLKEMLKN